MKSKAICDDRHSGLSLGALLFAVFLSGAAQAQDQPPKTINDCEKIQAADAYNQCLAKFGPEPRRGIKVDPEVSGGRPVEGTTEPSAASAPPEASPQPSSQSSSRSRGRHHRGATRHYHRTWHSVRHSGRQRAQFKVR